MTTLHLRKSIGRSPLRRGFLLIALALAWLTLSSTAEAQLPSPTPDGGYPGNNTAEGDGALSSVQISATTGNGIDNTAIGLNALFSNTTGSSNTATGAGALLANTTGGNNTAYGVGALEFHNTGGGNIALGFNAGINLTGSNNIDIGNVGVAGEAAKIRIGTVGTQKATFIAG